ncbi:unnamed protein product [Urochloa decumbens]|uniref:PGG domain-containing protein n=1 Tax=Urochloa decumbens TaxID=240449 RepID=A0ABC9B1Y4_9POAL
MASTTTTIQTHRNSENERRYMEELAGQILLLATLVATATYAAGFSPPGGVWQDDAGHLSGDPVIRSTQYVRYMMFFYCNATAFASLLMVLVFVILVCFVRPQDNLRIIVIPLVLIMILGLLSLIGAYAAATFWDMLTAVYTALLVAVVFTYVAIERVLASSQEKRANGVTSLGGERFREVHMNLASFALTVTYAGGLSTPGGFWDSTEGGNRPGDPILKGARLTVFFICNTTAFVASLLVVVVLLVRKIRRRMAAFWGAILACMVLLVFATIVIRKRRWSMEAAAQLEEERMEWEKQAYSSYIQFLATLALTITFQAGLHPPGGLRQDNGDGHKAGDPILRTMNLRRYNALFYCNAVAFIASLACMILVNIRPLLKYRALEQAMILDLLGLAGAYAIGSCREQTTTVYTMGIGGAALVYVVLHVVFLDDTDNNAQRNKDPDNRSLINRGYGLFLLAIFVASITYQAGLTPPGGFLLKDDESGNQAGDPVLLHNNQRRYRVFFYCNSTSFMASVAVIILLVNKNLYVPAIRTHALSVCTLVSFFCLLAAFAAGTTQHLKTSVYTLVLLAVVFFLAILLLLLFFLRSVIFLPTTTSQQTGDADADEPIKLIPTISIIAVDDHPDRVYTSRRHANRMYMMTVGVLVASVTYQASLDPPGGSWQRSSDGHNAGHPIMQDNRRQRYLVFFYSNSTTFMASIFLMVLLLRKPKGRSHIEQQSPLSEFVWSMTLKLMLMLDFLGLLGAYSAGSSRNSNTSVHVVAIVFSVLAYFTIYVVVSLLWHKGRKKPEDPDDAST